MEMLITLCIWMTGAVFGSFLLLLADRSCSTQYRSRLFPLLLEDSHCEHCQSPLHALDMIPFFSYIRLHGRCRNCYSTLSIRYPAAEFCTGIFAAAIYAHMGISVQSVSLFFIIACALFLTYADIRCMVIPNILLAVMAAAMLTSMADRTGFSPDNLYGMLFLGGIFLLILFIFPGSFGGGDVKYGALLGFYCGFPLSVVLLETALISGSLFGITYAVLSGNGLRIRIPFGPFLTIGFFTALAAGTEIMMMYTNLFT